MAYPYDFNTSFNPYTNNAIRSGLTFKPTSFGSFGAGSNVGKTHAARMASVGQTQAGASGGMKFAKPDAGGIASAATGAISLFSGLKAMGDDAAAAINTKAPAEMLDQNGEPLYNLGGFTADTDRVKPKGATGGEVLGAAAKGASAGAAFGPWGALIGGAVGAIGGLFGGRRRKRKMAEAKRKALRDLHRMQKNYNVNAENFQQNQIQQQQYQDSINNTDRMANLFGNNSQIEGA